jgi:hypothetical protein
MGFQERPFSAYYLPFFSEALIFQLGAVLSGLEPEMIH